MRRLTVAEHLTPYSDRELLSTVPLVRTLNNPALVALLERLEPDTAQAHQTREQQELRRARFRDSVGESERVKLDLELASAVGA